jgi:hypothetical protein
MTYACMNYFDYNRINTVILKFEAVNVINLLRNFKNGKKKEDIRTSNDLQNIHIKMEKHQPH